MAVLTASRWRTDALPLGADLGRELFLLIAFWSMISGLATGDIERFEENSHNDR